MTLLVFISFINILRKPATIFLFLFAQQLRAVLHMLLQFVNIDVLFKKQEQRTLSNASFEGNYRWNAKPVWKTLQSFSHLSCTKPNQLCSRKPRYIFAGYQKSLEAYWVHWEKISRERGRKIGHQEQKLVAEVTTGLKRCCNWKKGQ